MDQKTLPESACTEETGGDAAETPEKKDAEVIRLLAALDKANGEAAAYKRQLRAKMSEEEAAKQQAAEELAAMQEELKALRRENLLRGHTASLLALGYDEPLAATAAAAIVDGDPAALFAAMKKQQDAALQKERERLLHATPRPVQGNPGAPSVTADALRRMTPEERLAFYAENPDAYREAYGKSE